MSGCLWGGGKQTKGSLNGTNERTNELAEEAARNTKSRSIQAPKGERAGRCPLVGRPWRSLDSRPQRQTHTRRRSRESRVQSTRLQGSVKRKKHLFLEAFHLLISLETPPQPHAPADAGSSQALSPPALRRLLCTRTQQKLTAADPS